MDIDQVRSVAKNLKKIGAGIVLLTGGEPFMHDQLPEIVKAFVSQGLNVRLQTAGTKFATEEKLVACYEAGARDINVSLDSLELDKFDYINAVPSSAKNAIETIERISKIFRKKSAILSFGTVMSRMNYKEVPAIAHFAERIGWYISIVPVHITPVTVKKGFRSHDQDFLFLPGEYGALGQVIEKLIEMKRSGVPIFDAESFLRSSYSFLQGHGPTWRHKGLCDSPDLYFAIRPNGAFSTCCDYTLMDPPYVYEDRFVEEYKSGKIRSRKDVLSIVKNCSGCHYGSYPEVTLSIRDPKAFIQRTFMVLGSKKGRLANAAVQENFLEEVARIRSSYSDVYPTTNWTDPALQEKITKFSNKDTRKEIVVADADVRKSQDRVRGQGDDRYIGPEGQKL
jgi:MoaA/NifB/PqqE/SkfB family radical SAM enzyme